jgi:hypothetical protein
VKDRRFRKSTVPGAINVHHGLKEQKLPGEEFRYGIRGFKGATTEQCMKAGQRFGIDEYKQSVKERVYASSKMEPLAKAYIRGHKLKMLPEGFGKPSGEPEDCKKVVFPIDQSTIENEEDRVRYRKTHNHFAPGERVDRNYDWPKETLGEHHRFGQKAAQGIEGAGAKAALDCMIDDDGRFKKTRMVQKVCEDYRNTVHTKIGAAVHQLQGAKGPPVDPDFAHGIKSITSDFTARSCILGYYHLDEQLPDQDLGRCTKIGRRNVTRETRAFGVPSVRTDWRAPERRSVADITNYGNECGAAALLNPQRFDDRGVPDREFLHRRPKDELRTLVEDSGMCRGKAFMDFDDMWEQAVLLFDDGLELVSLDAFLYIYSQQIDMSVSKRLTGGSSKSG